MELGNTEGKYDGGTIAAGGLLLMAIVPIIYGPILSVRNRQRKLVRFEAIGEKPKVMTLTRAVLSPILASCLLVASYFYLNSTVELDEKTKRTMSLLLLELMVSLNCLEMAGIMLLYMSCQLLDVTMRYCVYNLCGTVLAVVVIRGLYLNKVKNGLVFLAAFFAFELLWAGTNIRSTVYQSLDIPVINLVVPKDLNGTDFMFLRLEDIVIPGVFIALMRRADEHLVQTLDSHVYCTISIVGYVISFAAKYIAEEMYGQRQSALLYLIPGTVVPPMLVALIKGDDVTMFDYTDFPDYVLN